MHPYYKKHEKKFKKMLKGFLSLTESELEEATGRDFPALSEEIWMEYRDHMLEEFPYIGGGHSSGTRNLTGAFVFVAMGEVLCGSYGVTLEEWGWLTTQCYERYFRRIPRPLRRLAGKLFRRTGLVNRLLRKKDRKNAANARRNPGSFETKTQPPTKEYPVSYYTLVCPLAGFARTHGYMRYMPYLCNLDYVMFEAFQVPFYREHTCADGDGFCDFRMKPGSPVNPAWPCHGVTPGDPLK